MESLKNYKIPLLTIFVVACVLLLFVTFGLYGIIISSDPDGLGRTLADANVEEPDPILALLGFLENDFVIAIIGILLIVGLSIGTFYLIGLVKNKKK